MGQPFDDGDGIIEGRAMTGTSQRIGQQCGEQDGHNVGVLAGQFQ